MLDTEAAYIAGFIDGEGSITIHKHNESKYRSTAAYSPSVYITNTQLYVLEWIKSTFHTGVIREHNQTKNGIVKTTKQCYRIFFEGDKCLYVLETVYPYLKIKLRHAIIVISYIKEYKGTPSYTLPKYELERREKLYQEIRILNGNTDDKYNDSNSTNDKSELVDWSKYA
jgi:hypothetical protein